LLTGLIPDSHNDTFMTIPFYEIKNDPSCDSVYPRLFTYPGILVLRDFPLTESRFRILRQSFSYEEIVDELHYCIGSRDSAAQLAWLIIDNLLTADAAFLYPETIRVLLDASLATVVYDANIKQKLSLMYPDHRNIFYLPDKNYSPILNALDYLKKTWKAPGSNFPRHLQPLSFRVKRQTEERLPSEIPSGIASFLDSA